MSPGTKPVVLTPKQRIGPRKQEGCSDISDNSEEVVLVEPDAESSRSTKGGQKHKKRHRHKRKNLTENIKLTKKRIHQEKMKKPLVMENELLDSSTDGENEVKGDSPKEEKSLLEMLELEMRRRAIQALLEKESHPDREGKDNNLDIPTLTTENLSDKNKKPNKTDKKSEKITPVRNFRKKKHTNDDVIVIVPELVTIDLTDENKRNQVDSNKVVNEHNKEEVENLINSIQINTDKEKDQLNQNNHAEDSSEECSNASETKSDIEAEGRKTVNDEVIDVLDSPEENETQNNTEKEQPNQEMKGGEDQQPKSNWATRWLDSKDVKRVVSTSKICGNIRKKIKNAKLAKKSLENSPKDIVDTPEIHGSVVEYQSLPKSSMTLDVTTETVSGNDTEAVKSIEDKSAQVDKIEGIQIVTDFKETALVVEQVQDVSSTKSEISVMTNTDNKIISDLDVNETLTSNSIDHNEEKGDDLQRIENLEPRPPTQVKISKSNIIDSSSKPDLLETDTPPLLSNESKVLSVSNEVNICDVNPYKVFTSQNLCSGVVNNLESEQIEFDQAESENTATYLEESESSSKISLCEHNESLNDESDNLKPEENIENKSSSVLDFNKTSKTIIHPNEDSSSCNSRKSSMSESSSDPIELVSLAKLKNTMQENGNELEALEIDITEEDREIE